tara:strand:- start:491 stop:766 length:276 start_codon:yes stop_codon:yes gene_type:complete
MLYSSAPVEVVQGTVGGNAAKTLIEPANRCLWVVSKQINVLTHPLHDLILCPVEILRVDANRTIKVKVTAVCEALTISELIVIRGHGLLLS